MIHSKRSRLSSAARTGLRSAPVSSPDGRRPYSAHRWPGGELLNDPMLLDEEFDEIGCEVPILLRIVNQP